MAAVRLTIRGRVQRVGFRVFVQRTAMTFGVAGEVWNTADGSVGVIAQHPDALHLEAFVRIMHEGPGEVSAVDVEVVPETERSGFVITTSR